MKELTIQEELELLKETFENNYGFIHNGSSRAVFKLPNNRVLKIAMDRQGRRQNQNEVFLFNTQGRKYLAEIYAYGKFVIVMEEVDEQGMEYMMDVYYGDYEEDFTPEQHQELGNLIELLEEYNGSTDDNFQIGQSTIDGRLVSFDYGFSNEYDFHQIVSRTLSDTVDYNGPHYIIENTMLRLHKLLDRNEKMCYNKV